MKQTPVRGPIASSSTHQEREKTSCLHSLDSSQKKARLREGKEHLFEIVVARPGQRLQLGKRPLAADPSIAQQYEAVAQRGGVGDLVNGEEQRAPVRRVRAESGRNFAGLPQVQAVER